MRKDSAMGIVFANLHDANIPEISSRRTMASVPFAGRYRMIDFCLAGMANAGMHNIGVVMRRNYQSLMDHLGNGREWDLSRKRGGLVIFPPHDNDEDQQAYQGRRLEQLNHAMSYLMHCQESLVILSDCDSASNLNYKELINHHLESGADVTTVYQKHQLTEGMLEDNVVYTLGAASSIREIRVNDFKKGMQNVSMNVYVIARELLIQIVKDAIVRGKYSFERDFLGQNLKVLKVKGYEFTGYCARIYDMASFFEENMRLLQDENLSQLFPPQRPVYTKVRDNAPVRYAMGSRVTNSIVADGCVIEGTVENCVLFRDVRVSKGAQLKNCIIMQGSTIEPGAIMDYVVTDKNVTVASEKTLCGAKKYPVFISKGTRVE